MVTYSHIELCAGTGMLGLGIKLALADGIRTMCYVEREAYAAATLVARMEDQTLDEAPVWDDLATIGGTDFCAFVDRLPRPMLLSGGYPCQPFSVAGKRLGADDERHLWPYIADFIGKTKPELCFFENVPGHLRLGFDTVHADLERLGYTVAAGLFTAAEVGASHKRERLFILAVSQDSDRRSREDNAQPCRRREPAIYGATVANTETAGCEGAEPAGYGPAEGCAAEYGGIFPPPPGDVRAWEEVLAVEPRIEPAVCRGAHGLANRVDRLRLAGNGVVPLVAAYAFVSLAAVITGGDIE